MMTRPLFTACRLRPGLLPVLLLAACASPKVQLDRAGAPLQGPIAIGESRGVVTGECAMGFAYRGYCDLMFEDLHGRRVDGHRIAAELDRKASTLAPLARWMKPVEGGMDSELPYDLFLLTITPEVVLAVPRGKPRQPRCWSVYEAGCIQSMGFRAHAYWYRTPPRMHPGSFWFSRAANGPQMIETVDAEVVIAVDRAVVRLKPNQGNWRVIREK